MGEPYLLLRCRSQGCLGTFLGTCLGLSKMDMITIDSEAILLFATLTTVRLKSVVALWGIPHRLLTVNNADAGEKTAFPPSN